MKKFIVYLLVIVVAVSIGFAVFYLVRDNEVISISSASIYKDAGDTFTIDINHENKKSYTSITISTSNANIVSYDSASNTFTAKSGGVARINFRTTNAKFRNLWCDVIVGDGTIESPYYISTPEQLASIGMGVEIVENGVPTGVYAGAGNYPEYSSDKCYKLVSNIDAKDINEGFWVPLRPFSGRFDGNGLTIRNINIDKDMYTQTFEDSSTYDPNIFSTENVGLFQKIMPNGIVYNLKLDNVSASGIYTNFGVIAGINYGTIERIEVSSAYLSVESEIFGGLVGKNITTESGENDTYIRNIARIDRCSIYMTAGKKVIYVDGVPSEEILGMNGLVGGLVGDNQGGTIVYSYANGEIAFSNDAESAIIYGGLIANNSYINLTKFAGQYTSPIQGGNIKDCYSNLKTTFAVELTNEANRFAGAIAINNDISNELYENDPTKQKVYNYLIGVYYNKDNLNFYQEGITKNFGGISEFNFDSKLIPFADTKMIVYGLTEEEMKVGDNFVSHTTQEINFDENGESLGIQSTNITWLFGTVWAIDLDTNNGMPYLNYQLVYIPDDFATAGVPIVENNTTYRFEKGYIEVTPTIISGTNGQLQLQVGDTYEIKVSPAGFSFDWVSSDSDIAEVDQKGIVTAKKIGVVTITVTNESGIGDTITLIITEKPYVITNYPSKIEIIKGQTYSLGNIQVNPSTTLNYLMLDNNIATVNTAGVVTGVNVGNTTLLVSAGNTQIQIPVIVREDQTNKYVAIVLEKNEIIATLSNSNISGKISIIKAYDINDPNTTDLKDVLTFGYTSHNTNIVEVSNDGSYIIKGTGTTDVSVYVDDENYFGTVLVRFIVSNDVQVEENIYLNYASYTMYAGTTLQLLATGTNKTPTWTTTNSNVVTVSGGLVRAVGKGTAQIIASIKRDNGTYAQATCYITVLEIEPIILSLTPAQSVVNVGETISITAHCNKDANINWNYSNPSLATISQINNNSIKVTMNTAGTLNITASIGSVSATAVITANDPNAYSRYIYTPQQLNSVRYHLDKEFVIAGNIDLSEFDWEPIGTLTSPFTGRISNLGNYTISNINVDGDYDYAGLFGYAKNATFEDLRINNANVKGKNVGTLLGTGVSVKINGVQINSTYITAYANAGGVVGQIMTSSTISDCVVNGITNIKAINGNYSGSRAVGGISGRVSATTLTNNTVDIQGSIALGSSIHGYAGGIAGYSSSNINSSYVSATISANDSDNDYAGGIVGYTTGNINKATIQDATISGYYAGGIGGVINVNTKITLRFDEVGKGFRKQDLSSSSYSTNVSIVAVKNDVIVKGNQVGGLFGVIKSGVVANCYTQATLSGASKGTVVKAGFASYIDSTGFGEYGGTGNAGIVENCYSACKFEGNGNNYAITCSLIHTDKNRTSGYCFNYLFDTSITPRGTIYNHDAWFDDVKSEKSTRDMTKSQTYLDKNFSSGIWNLSNGSYPTLKQEM